MATIRVGVYNSRQNNSVNIVEDFLINNWRAKITDREAARYNGQSVIYLTAIVQPQETDTGKIRSNVKLNQKHVFRVERLR